MTYQSIRHLYLRKIMPKYKRPGLAIQALIILSLLFTFTPAATDSAIADDDIIIGNLDPKKSLKTIEQYKLYHSRIKQNAFSSFLIPFSLMILPESNLTPCEKIETASAGLLKQAHTSPYTTDMEQCFLFFKSRQEAVENTEHISMEYITNNSHDVVYACTQCSSDSCSHTDKIKQWLPQATRSVIDYDLTTTLYDVLNGKNPAQILKTAGLVLSRKKPGFNVITTTETHNPSLMEVETDLKIKMYTYFLFHEGCPLIQPFDIYSNLIFPDKRGVNPTFLMENEKTASPIKNMIQIRKKYISHTTETLQPHHHNPTKRKKRWQPRSTNGVKDTEPSEKEIQKQLTHIYIARRGGATNTDSIKGDAQKKHPGAIFILNSHKTNTITVKFNTGEKTYPPMKNGATLQAVLNPENHESQKLMVDDNGHITLTIPPQHCEVYVADQVN